jgi:hypothetical protein
MSATIKLYGGEVSERLSRRITHAVLFEGVSYSRDVVAEVCARVPVVLPSWVEASIAANFAADPRSHAYPVPEEVLAIARRRTAEQDADSLRASVSLSNEAAALAMPTAPHVSAKRARVDMNTVDLDACE